MYLWIGLIFWFKVLEKGFVRLADFNTQRNGLTRSQKWIFNKLKIYETRSNLISDSVDTMTSSLVKIDPKSEQQEIITRV